jgi:predicted CXXCH cytochrome family protein
MTKEKACLNCHQPHASNHGQLLRGATQELCFQCHDQEVKREAGGTIPNMKAVLNDRQNAHSPAQRGDCTLCHQVHGGDRDRLLKREYVPTYASFENAEHYSLCFSCHDKNLVLAEETSAVTAFRNGERNLHFVHVNSRKSRSCNICHAPHAAEAAHIIRASYPFGPSRWDLAIAWQESPDGGSCAAGCHAAFAYDRVTPVVYPRIPIEEQDWRDGKPVVPGQTSPEETQ